MIRNHYFAMVLVTIICFYYEYSIHETNGNPITAKDIPGILLFPSIFNIITFWQIDWIKKQKQCENYFYLNKPDATVCDQCKHPHNLKTPIKNPLHEKYNEPGILIQNLKNNKVFFIFAGIFIILVNFLSNIYFDMSPKEKRAVWRKIFTITGNAESKPYNEENPLESTESNP